MQSNLLLVLTSVIWGVAFVFQAMGGDAMPDYAFNACRSLLAGIALLPVIAFSTAQKKKKGTYRPSTPKEKKQLIIAGVCVGAVLSVASAMQQLGISANEEMSTAGFITALYIVFVPVAGLFFTKKKPHFTVWVSVVLGVIGLYFISIKDGFVMQRGDILLFGCALGYTVHILVIDHFSPKVDGVKMSCIQFFACSVLSAVFMAIDGGYPTFTQIGAAIIPILFTGIMSSGVGYTLQIIAQRNTHPAVASLIMSLESVFAALAGWLILNESLGTRELLGCIIVFAAILLAQLPDILSAWKTRTAKVQ